MISELIFNRVNEKVQEGAGKKTGMLNSIALGFLFMARGVYR